MSQIKIYGRPDRIGKKIDGNIAKKRRLGMQAGGSGHLGIRSITKQSKNIKEIIHEGKPVTEVIVTYEIYTESEFECDPEDDI